MSISLSLKLVFGCLVLVFGLVSPCTRAQERPVLMSTPRAQAAEKAKLGKGRANPFSELSSIKPFPLYAKLNTEQVHPRQERLKIPPPPESSHHFQVPPPPLPPSPDILGTITNQGNGGFALPAPPEKPRLTNKLKLVGILGDSAIFIFSDIQFRRSHKYPKTLLLRLGDRFESVNLVSVENHQVALDEDGTRAQKILPDLL